MATITPYFTLNNILPKRINRNNNHPTMATSSKPKVLFVLTSNSKLGDTGKPTGWYLVGFPFNRCVVEMDANNL